MGRNEVVAMKRSITCASNLLFNGEVVGFTNAMELVILMTHEEAVGVDPDDRHGGPLLKSLDSLRATAQRLTAEYKEAIRAAERKLAERWAQDANEDVQAIAAALRDGDYSGLAI